MRSGTREPRLGEPAGPWSSGAAGLGHVTLRRRGGLGQGARAEGRRWRVVPAPGERQCHRLRGALTAASPWLESEIRELREKGDLR